MLAIVIPYYKLTFFKETLQSLANQTDKRFKVYIGDDASPENPSLLLEQFEDTFEFQYHRFANNVGGISLAKQWERAIALCGNEEWIMLLGDDDCLDKNVVEVFYENVEEIKPISKVIRFASQKIDDNGHFFGLKYLHPKIEKSTDFIFRSSRSSLSEYVFFKEKVLKIGFKNFPLAWFSDVLAVLEFSDFKEVFTLNNAVVYIRISKLSISGNANNLAEKAKSTFEFYHYLLTNQITNFSNLEKKILLEKINKCFLNNNKKLSWFCRISILYLKNLFFIDYFNFIKTIFITLYKKIF